MLDVILLCARVHVKQYLEKHRSEWLEGQRRRRDAEQEEVRSMLRKTAHTHWSTDAITGHVFSGTKIATTDPAVCLEIPADAIETLTLAVGAALCAVLPSKRAPLAAIMASTLVSSHVCEHTAPGRAQPLRLWESKDEPFVQLFQESLKQIIVKRLDDTGFTLSADDRAHFDTHVIPCVHVLSRHTDCVIERIALGLCRVYMRASTDTCLRVLAASQET